MGDIGEDGMTRSATGDTGAGTTLGTTEDTGECIIHGIRIMRDGTADSTHIGDMVMDLDLDMEDTSRQIPYTRHVTRHRMTTASLPEPAERFLKEVSAQAAAPAAEQSAAAHHEAVRQHRRLPQPHLPQEGQWHARAQPPPQAVRRQGHRTHQVRRQSTEGLLSHPEARHRNHRTPDATAGQEARAEVQLTTGLQYPEARQPMTETTPAAITTATRHRHLHARPDTPAEVAEAATAEAVQAEAVQAAAAQAEEGDKTIKTDIS